MDRNVHTLAACIALLTLLWPCGLASSSFAQAIESTAVQEAADAGPMLVGFNASGSKSGGDAIATTPEFPAPSFEESLPPAKPEKPVPATPVVTDVIVLIDATRSMAWPSGRERRMGIAQWAALDVADGVPEHIPAAFVALHDEAAALRQLLPLTNDGRGHLRRTVMRLVPAGEGKLDKLLVEARRLLVSKPKAVPLIVLVTDGVDCDPFSHGAPIRDLHQTYGDRLFFQVIGVGDNQAISAKLRDLANQGGRNGEYSSVKSHAELSTALSRVRQLFEEIGAQRARHAREQATELAQLRQERIALLADLERFTSLNEQLNRDLKTALGENNRLQRDVKELTREGQRLSAEVSTLGDQVEKLRGENVALAEDNQELNVEKTRLTQESANRLAAIDRLTEEKHDVELSRDGYRRAYWTWLVLALVFLSLFVLATLLWWFRTIRLLDRLAGVSGDHDELKTGHDGLVAKLHEAQEEIRCLEHKLVESRDRGGDLQQELDRSRDDCEKLEDHKRRLKCELEESEERRHALTHDLALSKDECGDIGRDHSTLKTQFEELCDRLKRLKRKNEELEQRAAASHHEADQTRHALAECRTQASRLEERLDACHQSKGDRDRRIHELEHLVGSSREEAHRLSHKLRRCHDRQEKYSEELLRASTTGAAAESRAEQLERALHECQRGTLQSSAAAARAEQEAAFAATLGATREMAANGRHHDCCHGHTPAQAPVIVAHNTPSHSAASPLSGAAPLGGASPLGGAAPVGGGVPGSTAAGGPAGTASPGGVAAGAPSAPASSAGPASSGPASAGPAATGSPAAPGAATGPAASPGAAGPASTSGSASGPASSGPAAGPAGGAAAGGAAGPSAPGGGPGGTPGGLPVPAAPGGGGGGFDLGDLAGSILGI